MSTKFGLAVLLALSVSACSQGKPDGKVDVEKQINSEFGGLVRLVSYEKTNGIDGEDVGIKTYEVEYQAEIEFTGGEPAAKICDMTCEKLRGMALRFALRRSNYPQATMKGQHAIVKGRIVYMLTDNGWQRATPGL